MAPSSSLIFRSPQEIDGSGYMANFQLAVSLPAVSSADMIAEQGR